MADGLLGPFVQRLRGLAGAGVADGALLERFAARRDDAAFAALVQRHGPMVLGVCRRLLKNAHDADDAFQATFLVLARKAASVRDQQCLSGWLHRVAHRVALRAKAGADRRRDRERPVAELPEPAEAPAAGDLREVLDAEVSRLPEKYRAPVVLCYLEGKTHAEAAALLRWPTGTVSGRLARARDLLRARLARRGLGSMEGATAPLVPPALAEAAGRAGALFGAGRVAPEGVAASTVALAKGVINAMWWTKLKTGVALVLTLGVAGAGAGLLARPSPSGQTAAAAWGEAVAPPARRGEGTKLRAAPPKPARAELTDEQILAVVYDGPKTPKGFYTEPDGDGPKLSVGTEWVLTRDGAPRSPTPESAKDAASARKQLDRYLTYLRESSLGDPGKVVGSRSTPLFFEFTTEWRSDMGITYRTRNRLWRSSFFEPRDGGFHPKVPGKEAWVGTLARKEANAKTARRLAEFLWWMEHWNLVGSVVLRAPSVRETAKEVVVEMPTALHIGGDFGVGDVVRVFEVTLRVEKATGKVYRQVKERKEIAGR